MRQYVYEDWDELKKGPWDPLSSYLISLDNQDLLHGQFFPAGTDVEFT